jgi:hypothetical protein
VANATPARFGSIDNGDDGTFANDFALMLKVWAGEVLSAFAERNIIAPLVRNKTIATGKTAQFIVSGKADAGYHTPGVQLLGTQSVPFAERTINVDPAMISDAFIANFDEVIAHYDGRKEHTVQLARALARKSDKQLLQLLVLAARAAAVVTGLSGGSVLVDANFETDGEALYQGLFDAQQAMDEKDIPEESRYAVFKPEQFSLLARETKFHNQDWGGTGSIADGDVHKLAGFKILKSNNLPQSNISVDSPAPNNTYHANFTNTMGVCFQGEAIGVVSVRDMVMEQAYDVSRQGTLLVAKKIQGAGILRPDCSVEMAKA